MKNKQNNIQESVHQYDQVAHKYDIVWILTVEPTPQKRGKNVGGHRMG